MISAHLTMVDNVPWSALIQRPWSALIQRPWSDTIATTLSTMVKRGWQWKTMVPWSSCRRGWDDIIVKYNVVSTAIKRDHCITIIYVKGILSNLLAANATYGWTMKLPSDTNEFPFYRSTGFSFMVINFIGVLLYLNWYTLKTRKKENRK